MPPINRQFVSRIAELDRVFPKIQDMVSRAPSSVVLGVVSDIKKDDNPKGEVKVVYTALNPDKGLGEGQEALESNWILPMTPFEGVAPETLLYEEVVVILENNDWNTAYYTAPRTTQQPTGPVIRVATYERGQLPPASANNLGTVALELDWPPGSHSLVTVVKRNGRYIWAGSSHSMSEMTPLSWEAQELISRAAAQKEIFIQASDSVLSGAAFESIKNKKERAVLTAISQAALRAVTQPIMNAIAPIADVGRRFLEASFQRYPELINQVSTMADKLEAFAEFTIGDPRSIPKALSAVKDLIGGVLNDVMVIVKDVKQYLGQDLVQGAIGAIKDFPSQVQDIFPQIIKQGPRVLGQELTKIVGGKAGELLKEASPFASQFTEVAASILTGDLSSFDGIVASIREAGFGIVSPELAQALALVQQLPEPIANLLPDNIQAFLDNPPEILSLIKGAESEVTNEFRITEDPVLNAITVESFNPDRNLTEARLTGTLSDDRKSVTIDTWEQLDLGSLRASVRQLYNNTNYDVFVKGGSTAFFPSLGFELYNKAETGEEPIWQYLG